MSLKNISISPLFLAQLYQSPIIPEKLKTDTAEQSRPLSYLGNNHKHITVFIENDKNTWLPEDLFTLLTNILNACHWSLEDIALVNVSSYPDSDFTYFKQELNPEKVILLGSGFEKWSGNHLEKNNIQLIDRCTYLWSDSLQLMQEDIDCKKLFWKGLQDLLNLK